MIASSCPLFAGIQFDITSSTSFEQELHRVDEYEENGDYAHALLLAKQLKKSLPESTSLVSVKTRIQKLESKWLSKGYSLMFFNENFEPRAKLLKVLETTCMPPVTSIAAINAFAQKNFLRSGERWNVQSDHFEVIKSSIKPLLAEMGFIEATTPSFREYQGAIIHGALISRVRLRLDYLIQQWKSGVRFTELYFLTGMRPLEPQYENKEAFLSDANSPLKIRKDWVPPEKMPQTESEMIKLVWEQSCIPEDMLKEVSVYFINAPMKKNAEGKELRPTTDDTVNKWLSIDPPHGRYLAVTNAPYTPRQDLVMRSLVTDENYGFDTIGSCAHSQEKISILLDELARVIFQNKKMADTAKNR